MTTFNYSIPLPRFRNEVDSGPLKTYLTDIKDHINGLNPQGWTFPNTPASQYQALLFGTGSAFTLSHVIRSSVALNNDAGAGTVGTSGASPLLRPESEILGKLEGPV